LRRQGEVVEGWVVDSGIERAKIAHGIGWFIGLHLRKTALFHAVSDNGDADVHTSPNVKTPTHTMYPAQKNRTVKYIPRKRSALLRFFSLVEGLKCGLSVSMLADQYLRMIISTHHNRGTGWDGTRLW
jgi:hypothetical protein